MKPEKDQEQFKLNDISSDGLSFQSNDQLNKEMKDELSLLFKENIVKQANNVTKDAETKQISEIFEFDKNTLLNENIPGISMSFLDRLFHQITRPRDSKFDYSSDDDFAEIDQTEITAVVNDSFDHSLDSDDKAKDDNSVKNSIRSFFEEISEETEVIRGILKQQTLINRRSEKAKTSPQPIEKTDNQTLIKFLFF